MVIYGILIGIVTLSLMQGAFALAYALRLLNARQGVAHHYCPKAAVILSLRGSDPFLITNMSAVLDQDYADFKLFIIVDSEHDSAWPDVLQLQLKSPQRVETRVLKNPLTTCSLKCSALAEMVEKLDDGYEVVAFLDGDAAPHRTWLRELVEPLAGSHIGVTTGNRWYTPTTISWGTLVRYFWNAGAVVQVWLNGITWAGSMAMRRKVIADIGLIAAWRTALSVDGTVVRQVRAAGLKTYFVPTVILPNREEISVASFIPWSERQLIAARSSGSGWSIVLFHAFAIATCVFAPPVILIAGLMKHYIVVSSIGAVALLVYWSSAIVSTLVIEFAIQNVLQKNQVASKWINVRAAVAFLPAVVFSHLVYFRALAGACFRSRIAWRGVEYQISRDNKVRMLDYLPYQTQTTSQNVESVV